MKTSQLILTLALAGTMNIALAGNLSDAELTTFNSGDPLSSADMNANFDAAQADINDNDGRTTTNAGAITTNAGAITTNAGAITGHETRIGALEAAASSIRYVSVSSSGGHLQAETNACGGLNRDQALRPLYTAATTCAAFAPVSIPDGATANSLMCRLYDNGTDKNVSVSLVRHSSGGAQQTLFTVATTNANNAGFYTVSDSTISNAGYNPISNQNYAYAMTYNWSDSSGFDYGPWVYNCSISYN